jgi:antirestriction protein ArdC
MSQKRHQRESGPSPSKATLYQEVTDRIVGELEQGRVPWVQPWDGANASLGLPKNTVSGRHYSGINILILWDAVITRGFGAQRWLTFRQALGLGGHVRKGERGTTICYADRFIPKDEQARARDSGDEPSGIPFLKRFTVFNTEQCEGLPQTAKEPPRKHCDAQIIPAAEATIAATAADFRIGGGEAFYHRGDDFIGVPPQTSFFEAINYYRTCLHELGHWTGHPARLARDLTGRFGSTGYAREELVAEMTSAFLCAHLSIIPTVRHADYIGAWLGVMREDSKAIFQAASQASKAADFILAFQQPYPTEIPPHDAAEQVRPSHRPDFDPQPQTDDAGSPL